MPIFRNLADHKNNGDDYDRAKKLRRHASPVEKRLEQALRPVLKPLKLRLRFQHPISPYIVDFAILKARLIIEIDGPSHDSRYPYDQQRDAYLKNPGYSILHFSNQDVLEDGSAIIATIYARLMQSGIPHP